MDQICIISLVNRPNSMQLLCCYSAVTVLAVSSTTVLNYDDKPIIITLRSVTVHETTINNGCCMKEYTIKLYIQYG